MKFGTLLEAAYRRMGAKAITGTATSGTTLTLVDSSLINKYPVNFFNASWALFIHTTTDGGAPQAQFKTCSSFARATGTITAGAAFTAAPGAGDGYALYKMPVKLESFARLALDALLSLGAAFIREDTSLSSTSSTLQYNLPAAIAGQDIVDVFLRDTDNYKVAAPNWDIIPAAPGGTRKLNFWSQPAESNTIVIRYKVEHPTVAIYSDDIDEGIPSAIISQAVAVEAYRSIMMPQNRKRDVANYESAMQELQRLQVDLAKQKETLNQPGLRIGIYN